MDLPRQQLTAGSGPGQKKDHNKAVVRKKSDIVKRIKFLLETHIPVIWNIHFEGAEKGIPASSTPPFFGSSLPEKAAEKQPPIEKELPGSL